MRKKAITIMNEVVFQIDKCTIPSKLLEMRQQRRDSIREMMMHRSPSDPDFAQETTLSGNRGRGRLGRSMTCEEEEQMEEAERERRETALPSQQLRRWQKLGRVMGVAFGMRELARSYKCASDPELVRSVAQGQAKQVIAFAQCYFRNFAHTSINSAGKTVESKRLFNHCRTSRMQAMSTMTRTTLRLSQTHSS